MRGLNTPKNLPDLLNSLNFQSSHLIYIFAMIFLFLIDTFFRRYYNIYDFNYHRYYYHHYTRPTDMMEYWDITDLKKNMEDIYSIPKNLSITYYLGCGFLVCVSFIKVYWESLQYLAKYLSYNLRRLAIFYSIVETFRLIYYFVILDLFLTMICNGNSNSFWSSFINLKSFDNVLTLRNFLELNYFSLQNHPSSFEKREDYLINGDVFVNCLNNSYYDNNNNNVGEGIFTNYFFKMDVTKKRLILDFYNNNNNNQNQSLHQVDILNLKRSFLTFFYIINNENLNLLNQKLQIELFVISGFSFALYYLIFQYLVPIIRINYIIRKNQYHHPTFDHSSSSSSLVKDYDYPYYNHQRHDHNYNREHDKFFTTKLNYNNNMSPKIEEISSYSQGGRHYDNNNVTHLKEPFA